MRDASQQAYKGTEVDISKGLDNLKVGDLLFFGRIGNDGKERIRHVGFYIGGSEFIHASGWVRIGNLNPNSENYDPVNAKELIRASRMTGSVDVDGFWSVRENPFFRVFF